MNIDVLIFASVETFKSSLGVSIMRHILHHYSSTDVSAGICGGMCVCTHSTCVSCINRLIAEMSVSVTR